MSYRAKVPKPTVKRLSLYLRELEHRVEQKQPTISSRQLGDALGLTDAQVRKDLAYFGQFGHPGIGYDVTNLVDRLRKILGTDRTWNTALIGAGNLGRALMAYGGWQQRGFDIVAVFDQNPDLVGQWLENHRIRPMSDLAMLVKERDIRLAMIAVPADRAQEVADRLIAAGVRGILNFAPRRLDVHQAVSISSVDLALSLEQLAFQVSLGLLGSLDEDDD
ncbi:MAG: redox-sensing transcriptional repressor Rex [Phycisphaeraceae bacterium]|nr:MAG: redox-sensing transcriptional repressor Rex [Phycisphaeraceae bacterium]